MTCLVKENKNFIFYMQWKCYELVIHGKMQLGNPNKVLQLQYKETILVLGLFEAKVENICDAQLCG
jgi:hypothetical protein